MCEGHSPGSVEILGYSTGFTPPQFQLFALAVLGVLLVIAAFTIVLLAPPDSPSTAPAVESPGGEDR